MKTLEAPILPEPAVQGPAGADRPDKKMQTAVRILSVLLTGLVLLFAAVLIRDYFRGAFRSVASLQLYMDRFGRFGPLFLTSFQAVQVIIPVLPGFLGCAAGSVMFGPSTGFWCNYIGISGGSIIAFFLARRFGAPLMEVLFPRDQYAKWSSRISESRSYVAFLFMAMLLPLFPDDYLCYLTGLTKMTAKRFIWIIVLGKPWCILAYSLGFSLLK